jgi:hypothetical protein
LRLLLSAFCCEPGKGSDPKVGLRTLLAAAARHEVWMLTSDTGAPALCRFLDACRPPSLLRRGRLPSLTADRGLPQE